MFPNVNWNIASRSDKVLQHISVGSEFGRIFGLSFTMKRNRFCFYIGVLHYFYVIKFEYATLYGPLLFSTISIQLRWTGMVYHVVIRLSRAWSLLFDRRTSLDNHSKSHGPSSGENGVLNIGSLYPAIKQDK